MSAALAGLDAHARRLAGASLPDLIDDDPRRARDFSLRVGPLYANFARQRYDRLALDALFALADARDLAGAMRRLLDGDIVSIGIGGSDLGPRLVVDALATHDARFRLHFISNVDGNAAERVLAGLDPARTAAIVISKTFGTQETLLNGGIVRAWLGDDSRLYAVSSNLERVAAFGIPPERTLPMWERVGGRY